MLRAILIVFIGIALSACRSGDEVSSTDDERASGSQVTQTGADHSPLPLAGAIPGKDNAIQQAMGTADPVYDPQPAAPPEVQFLIVTLEWTIPVQRENGDLLSASDLDGYIIEFIDQSSPDMVDKAYVEGGQVNSYALNLPPGSYQFRLIAVDIHGLTSKPSDWVNADLV